MDEERRKDKIGVPAVGRRTGDFEHEINAIRISLETHIRAFNRHDEIEKKDRERIVEKLHENTTKIDLLSDNTKELIEAWKAFNGAVKFGSALGKLTTWLSGLAVVGYLIHSIGEHFKT